VDINNLGKIGGLSIGDFFGFFVKVPVFGRIVQVRLTGKVFRGYILAGTFGWKSPLSAVPGRAFPKPSLAIRTVVELPCVPKTSVLRGISGPGKSLRRSGSFCRIEGAVSFGTWPVIGMDRAVGIGHFLVCGWSGKWPSATAVSVDNAFLPQHRLPQHGISQHGISDKSFRDQWRERVPCDDTAAGNHSAADGQSDLSNDGWVSDRCAEYDL